MKYLYSALNCPRCEKRKTELRDQSIAFVERDADRLKKPADDKDDIDVEAFVQLSMQNMILPVEVDSEK